MRSVRLPICLVVVCVMAVANVASADTFGSGDNQFTIDFVPISGSTNPTSGIPAGSGFTFTGVNNSYRIGTYEISNDQWNKFNAFTGMNSQNPYWTGANIPVNTITWYGAALFVNYLNTSTGHSAAYKFTGTPGTSGYRWSVWSASDAGYNASNPYRNSNAFYFLPTENEWVKAAYWNGTSLQTYANASAGDLVSGLPDPTKWNYSPYAGREPWEITSGIEELNGTYNMMGNVWEWMESPPSCMRGGAYYGGAGWLASSSRNNEYLGYKDYETGFRVASVPEPATLLLFGLGCLRLRKRLN